MPDSRAHLSTSGRINFAPVFLYWLVLLVGLVFGPSPAAAQFRVTFVQPTDWVVRALPHKLGHAIVFPNVRIEECADTTPSTLLVQHPDFGFDPGLYSDAFALAQGMTLRLQILLSSIISFDSVHALEVHPLALDERCTGALESRFEVYFPLFGRVRYYVKRTVAERMWVRAELAANLYMYNLSTSRWFLLFPTPQIQRIPHGTGIYGVPLAFGPPENPMVYIQGEIFRLTILPGISDSPVLRKLSASIVYAIVIR